MSTRLEIWERVVVDYSNRYRQALDELSQEHGIVVDGDGPGGREIWVGYRDREEITDDEAWDLLQTVDDVFQKYDLGSVYTQTQTIGADWEHADADAGWLQLLGGPDMDDLVDRELEKRRNQINLADAMIDAADDGPVTLPAMDQRIGFVIPGADRWIAVYEEGRGFNNVQGFDDPEVAEQWLRDQGSTEVVHTGEEHQGMSVTNIIGKHQAESTRMDRDIRENLRDAVDQYRSGQESGSLPSSHLEYRSLSRLPTYHQRRGRGGVRY